MNGTLLNLFMLFLSCYTVYPLLPSMKLYMSCLRQSLTHRTTCTLSILSECSTPMHSSSIGWGGACWVDSDRTFSISRICYMQDSLAMIALTAV